MQLNKLFCSNLFGFFYSCSFKCNTHQLAVVQWGTSIFGFDSTNQLQKRTVVDGLMAHKNEHNNSAATKNVVFVVEVTREENGLRLKWASSRFMACDGICARPDSDHSHT